MPLNLGSTALAGLIQTGSELASGHHQVTDGLRGILGSAGLRKGASYLVESSTSLSLAMLTGASQAGSWTAVIGMPSLGVQAAAGLGIDTDRLVLVPDPGSHWLEVTATLADAVDVILLRLSDPPRDGDVRRLAARLRQRGTSLIVHGRRWPGAELRLSISDSQWIGASADGHGYLSARHALVTASGKGTPRTERLWLPAPDGGVRPYLSDELAGRSPGQSTTRPHVSTDYSWTSDVRYEHEPAGQPARLRAVR